MSPNCYKHCTTIRILYCSLFLCFSNNNNNNDNNNNIYRGSPTRQGGFQWGSLSPSSIVSRGDWLGKPANFKVENSGTVGYVGSSLTPCNPLFFVHKLRLNKLMQCFY